MNEWNSIHWRWSKGATWNDVMVYFYLLFISLYSVLVLNVNHHNFYLDLQLPMHSVTITTNAMSSHPTHGEVYLMQIDVIKFVSDLRQVSGFLRTLRYLSPIIYTHCDDIQCSWNILLSFVLIIFQKYLDTHQQTWTFSQYKFWSNVTNRYKWCKENC